MLQNPRISTSAQGQRSSFVHWSVTNMPLICCHHLKNTSVIIGIAPLHIVFPLPGLVRHISEEQLSASAEQVTEVLERNLLKASRKKPDEPRQVLTTRREATSLYREILRYSNLFLWRDTKGQLWRDVLRESARKEFEAARFEHDPEIVNKLIITGRDCVHRTMEAFAERTKTLVDEPGGSYK